MNLIPFSGICTLGHMEITRTSLPTIAHLRKEFLSENNIQFILDKAHRYGWADLYVFTVNQSHVGYGSVWGKEKREDRDAIFEFYLVSEYRQQAQKIFVDFCHASKAPHIESQSNDKFLYPMFEKFADNVETEAILFADDHETNFDGKGSSLLPRPQSNPDDCQYALMNNGEEVGEGGFMLNYNLPYADIYYSVGEQYRRKGFGSFIVQELKKEIYKMGRVPAARCNAKNMISKATLLKAGLVVCGERLSGDLKKNF